MSSKRGFGTRITGALSRVGQAIARAATSDTARRIATTAGRAVERAAKSEIGQRAIAGVVEGAVQSAVTGESFSETVKKAVILNVAGVHPTPPDPLNPAEIQTQLRLNQLQQENAREEAAIKHLTQIEKFQASEIDKVKKWAKIEAQAEQDTQLQVTDLEDALKATSTLVAHEREGLEKLMRALKREDKFRTEDERHLIDSMKHNFGALVKSVESERNALIEEAVEQTIDLGGEIAEHAAASVPLVGEAVATGMATARGAMQIYRLGKTIATLSGLHTAHIELPQIHQGALETAYLHQNPTSDQALVQVAQTRMSHVEEIATEVAHLQRELPARMRGAIQDCRVRAPEKIKAIGHPMRMAAIHETHVPVTSRPMIHVYTSAFDSEYMMLFHIIGPYSAGSSFVFCVDLALDLFHLEETAPPNHMLHVRTRQARRTYQAAFTDFFRAVASIPEATQRHATRLGWSAGEGVLHISSFPYSASYQQMLINARRIASDRRVQVSLLRGLLPMQRRAILNALQHGVVLIAPRWGVPPPPRR
ncbi:outer capsid protein 2 [Chenuda virus]|uniref:Outer capsid protein VP5 n=1 Tax=Chenuda virus TaxID=40065 RepID=A0A0H4M6S2_9REOV|nr:outer capsid protein 2 [Chenuda virus]AKP24090.1 outer capsid protein 2 [Chenuda virus]